MSIERKKNIEYVFLKKSIDLEFNQQNIDKFVEITVRKNTSLDTLSKLEKLEIDSFNKKIRQYIPFKHLAVFYYINICLEPIAKVSKQIYRSEKSIESSIRQINKIISTSTFLKVFVN